MPLAKFFLVIVFAVCLSSSAAFAQDDLSIDSLDKKTEELFAKKQWNEIIILGKRALAVRIESYFLRVRLGIAYFNIKKYFDAIPNFEKAIDIAYPDPEILRYLYLSYIYTGRDEDANFTFYLLPENERERIRPLVNSFVNDLNVGSGLGISNDIDNNSSIDLDGPDNIYGEQILSGNYFYVSGGIRQIPLKWIGVTYDYAYLKFDRTKQIQFNNEKYSDSYSQKQNQFYNKYDFRIANGLIISPAGRYIQTDDNTIFANYDSVSYSYDPASMTYDSIKYYYTLTNQPNILDNFVLSLAVFKYLSIYRFGLNGSFSYLNNEHQSQYGLSFRFFPGGKINFYSSSDLVLQNQNKISNLIFSQSLSGKIYKGLWGEAFGTYGNMNNFNEQNGYIVYNNPDVIKYKLGAELKYYFPFNMTAYLVYEFQQRDKDYLTYSYTQPGSSLSYGPEGVRVNYQVSILAAGVKIIF